MSTAILGVGVPGAGKTTVLKPLAARLGAAYLCPDDIRAELSGGDPTDRSQEELVWDLTRERSRQALAAGDLLFVDATFTDKTERSAFIEFLRHAGAGAVLAAWADVPREHAHARNAVRDRVVPAGVIDDRYAELATDPPCVEDGFDAVVPLAELPDRFA